MTASEQACRDLLVVTIGTGMAVDLPTMVMADNGARVVKVERPGGDPLRSWLPSGFLVWNRGKESVELDLRDANGAAQASALARAADVVVVALGPGVAERRGLGVTDLLGANPALVHCAVSGFGSNSPYSSLKAYDGVVAAKAGGYGPGLGAAFRQGPIFTGTPRASVGAAHHVLQGVLAALVAREATGRGQSLEVSLFGGLSPYDYFGTAAYQLIQRQPERLGNRGMPRVPGGLLCTKDGYWVLPTNRLRKEYEALVRALELDEVWDDPRFCLDGEPGEAPTIGDESDARSLWDLVRLRTAERTLAEWQPRFDIEDDLAAEWVRTCEQALEHPQMLHNGHVVTVPDRRLGPIRQVGPIANFSATPSQIRASAPDLNEHGLLGRPESDRPTVAPRTGSPLDHPLSGITIVEVGHHYAMPYAITMVAALGARVIKIEAPAGDHMRDLIPLPEAGGHKVMAGKESVIADLGRPEGREIVYRLVRHAQVFALGLRGPAALEMGMDEASVRAANPEIVYFNAAGYGDSGPFYRKAMHAGTAGAATGALYRQGGAWLDPSQTVDLGLDELEELSLRFGNGSTGDAAAAASAGSALMVAILALQRFGVTQSAVTSMLMGNAMSYSDDFTSYAGKPPALLPDADQFGFNALYRIYPAATGWVFIACPAEEEWRALCTAADRHDLLDDPRFSTSSARQAHDAELTVELDRTLRSKPAEDWESRLGDHGVACVQVYEGSLSQFTCTDPGVRSNDLVIEVDEPVFGPMLRHGAPVVFSETPARLEPGCWAGQHTHAVLSEFGYSEEEIRTLDDLGVTTSTRPTGHVEREATS